MRPTARPPLTIRDVEFGGPSPLFCVPLVAQDDEALFSQAKYAHHLGPDVVEWRADSYGHLDPSSLAAAAKELRAIFSAELLLFTLRIHTEGGRQKMEQSLRLACIEAVLRSGSVDIVDIELCNEPEFRSRVLSVAHEHSVRVIFSFHDFVATPDNSFLQDKIATMLQQGADIAKVACMPQDPTDVLRLFEVTLQARRTFPAAALCTMSMGGPGALSRIAGFLYGSDMAFAVAQESSAPGQIPLQEAREAATVLLQYV